MGKTRLVSYSGWMLHPPPSLEALRRLENLSPLVGNTPLLSLECTLDGVSVRVLAKLESANWTGSIKDRMALEILRAGTTSGALQPEDTIVEMSSGNTGISFAAIGRALGHPVRIYMPDWMSEERRKLIELAGAEIILVSRAEGGFMGALEQAQEWSRENQNAFLPDQFSHPANTSAHEKGTGPELLQQANTAGYTLQGFVAGVGTGGTLSGMGRALCREYPDLRVHPVEPAESPTLSTGHRVGSHRIQGISDEFIPDLLDLGEWGPVMGVSDGDAIRVSQRLAREYGLGVGISSGANLVAALRLGRELTRAGGRTACVATVFPDSNKKYLSTALTRVEPPQDGHACDCFTLKQIRALPRCGHTSLNP